MAVSANTLFHFTGIKGLKGILSSGGFYCQYSDEHFENILPQKSIYRVAYIPMICFCDLTIMQLSNHSVHRECYGDFGLGLTKDWGIKNNVSPVMYVHRNSQQTRRLNELIKSLSKFRKAGDGFIQVSKIEDELIDSFKYIKPYHGNWHKGDKKPMIYYNEREWRYSPSLKENSVLSGKIKGNKDEKDKINILLKKKLIRFEPEDVKFIIIENKRNASEIAKVIQRMKITSDQKNLLITKIISFQEIEEDFG